MLIHADGSNTLLLLLLALGFDLAFGDMAPVFRWLPHPVALIGQAIGFLDRRLNRPGRSDKALELRGVLTVTVLVAGAAALGWLVAEWCSFWQLGWVAEALVAAVLLAGRSLFDHVVRVRQGLALNGVAGGREAVAHIVGRDPASLDEYGVARAAIESLFENFSDGLVAPAFWYALFGLPGIFAYKAANTADSMIGHRSPRYLHFGWAAARFDDLANWLPARLAAILISVAALPLPGLRAGGALKTMLRDAGKHRSVNAGWPEAAAAGALGLALAGPRRYGGQIVQDPWLGDGRARATEADIARALKLYLGAGGLLALLIALGAVAL